MTVACESTHCPLASCVMPEIDALRPAGACELDAREQALAVARPFTGLGALQSRLRHGCAEPSATMVCSRTFLPSTVVVTATPSARRPDTDHQSGGDRNRLPAQVLLDDASIRDRDSIASRMRSMCPVPELWRTTRAAQAGAARINLVVSSSFILMDPSEHVMNAGGHLEAGEIDWRESKKSLSGVAFDQR